MTQQHKLIQALRGEPHDGVPVWFMRQAGRYLPGYQKVRAKERLSHHVQNYRSSPPR